MRLAMTALGGTIFLAAGAQAQGSFASPPFAATASALPQVSTEPRADDPAIRAEQDAMAAAQRQCDEGAWDYARERLNALVESQLETEKDMTQRRRLNGFRNAANLAKYRPCTYPSKELRERIIMLSFLYGPMFWTQVGTGVVRNGAAGSAPERYAMTSKENLDTFAITAGLDLGRVGLGAGYSFAGAKKDYSITGGADTATGMVFGGLSPANSSGYIANFDAEGEFDAEFESFYLEMMYDLFGSDYDEDEPKSGLKLTGYLQYEQSRSNYDSRFESGGMIGGTSYYFGQVRDQRVRQINYAAGLDLESHVRFTEHLGLKLNARAGGAYQDYSLRSREHNMASYGPMSTRDFRIDIDEDKEGFGLHGRVEAQLQFKVGAGAAFTATVGARYWEKAATVRNPVDGDEVFYDGRRTELITPDRTHLFGGLGFQARF